MTTIDRIAAVYLDVIGGRLGLQVDLDGELVVLRSEGRPYLIDLQTADPEYLRVSLGGQHGCDLDETSLAKAAASASRWTKGAKVSVDGDTVIIACEMVIAPPNCLPGAEMVVAVLPRALAMIDAGARRFLEECQLAGIAAASAGIEEDVA